MDAASQAGTETSPQTLAQVHPTRRGFVLSWWSFTVTFIFLRALTLAIHEHVAGLGNVSAGGVHLHHYLWGILLVSLVASAGPDRALARPGGSGWASSSASAWR